MNHTPVVYVYCYDVSDDRRRRRVYELLREYGQHLQFSVFRCALSPVQKALLDAALAEAVAPRSDQVMIIRLGKEGSRRGWPVDTIGRALQDVERSAWIV